MLEYLSYDLQSCELQSHNFQLAKKFRPLRWMIPWRKQTLWIPIEGHRSVFNIYRMTEIVGDQISTGPTISRYVTMTPGFNQR